MFSHKNVGMWEDDIGKISYLKADKKLYLVVIICLVIRLFILFIATLVILYIHIVVGWRISGMIWSRKSIVFHLVLQTINRQSCTITEKAPTRTFSWLKAATTAFTFKTLLRHFAKPVLTPTQLLSWGTGAAFNQEKALVGAFSVILYDITNFRMELFETLLNTASAPHINGSQCRCEVHYRHASDVWQWWVQYQIPWLVVFRIIANQMAFDEEKALVVVGTFSKCCALHSKHHSYNQIVLACCFWFCLLHAAFTTAAAVSLVQNRFLLMNVCLK